MKNVLHDPRASMGRNRVLVLLMVVAAFALGYALRGAPSAPAGPSVVSNDAAPTLYTCSMHPSVRLEDPDAKCPICFMDLIAVTRSAAQGDVPTVVLDPAALALAEVVTTPVRRSMPTAEVRLFGELDYDRTRVARIAAYFPGRIERLFVDYVGMTVRAGDHLAEVYSPELLGAFEELHQARRTIDESRSGSALVRDASVRMLDAAREKLRLYGLTGEQIAAAEAGGDARDRLTIHAPIGGVVTALSALEGDYLRTGESIATVADPGRLWLEAEAYESQLPLLRWGQDLRFTVLARPGEVFRGKVSFIAPELDRRSRTARVRVAVDNADGRLKAGMFAHAVVSARLGAEGVVTEDLVGKWVSPMHPEVVKDGPGNCDVCGMALVPAAQLGLEGTGSSPDAPLVVPRSAVLLTGTRALVYVRDPNARTPTFTAREILLGERAQNLYVVRAGLAEGELVVTHGAFKIDSAMQIEGQPSMMQPSEEASTDRTIVHVPETFRAGLSTVFDSYLDAQEALGADDLERFVDGARALRRAVIAVDVGGVEGDALQTWRRGAAVLRLEDAPVDLVAARTLFESMSRAMIEFSRSFGNPGEHTVYLAFCPMAFDNTGAEWLQRDATVFNPYFGASMLRCGEIRAEFEPVAGPTGDQEHAHE